MFSANDFQFRKQTTNDVVSTAHQTCTSCWLGSPSPTHTMEKIKIGYEMSTRLSDPPFMLMGLIPAIIGWAGSTGYFTYQAVPVVQQLMEAGSSTVGQPQLVALAQALALALAPTFVCWFFWCYCRSRCRPVSALMGRHRRKLLRAGRHLAAAVSRVCGKAFSIFLRAVTHSPTRTMILILRPKRPGARQLSQPLRECSGARVTEMSVRGISGKYKCW